MNTGRLRDDVIADSQMTPEWINRICAVCDEIDRLTAENKRYREALEDIVGLSTIHTIEIQKLAEAALEGE